MPRQVLERWSAALGGCVLGGLYVFYVLIWVIPHDGPQLEGFLRAVVDGTAVAPYQYRFLVPVTEVWLHDHTALTIGEAVKLVDGVAMAVGAVVGFAVLKRARLGLYALPASLYCAYIGIGIASLAKPETITAFAGTTAALIALERRPRNEGWWSPAVTWSVLAVAALVLAGCRTDLLCALGFGFAARWWMVHDRRDAVAATGLVIAAAAGSLALVLHFPHTHYPKGVGLVQLGQNFDAFPLVTLAIFLLPALAPLVLMWRYPTIAPSVRSAAKAHGPLLTAITTEVLATLVVGRIDEVRLVFPLAFALAWVGIDLWRAVIVSIDIDIDIDVAPAPGH